MIDNAQAKEIIQNRIKFIKEMIEVGKQRVNEPYNKQHWTGYLAALEGEVGELKFLEKLFKQL